MDRGPQCDDLLKGWLRENSAERAQEYLGTAWR